MLLSLRFPVYADGKECSQKEARNAETDTDYLRSWDDVYRSYERFAQCDEGAIWEGYSDKMATLLSDQWNTVGRLNQLVQKDRGFQKFVIKHIDELMTPEQAKKITYNASRCPNDSQPLCKQITKQINKVGPSIKNN